MKKNGIYKEEFKRAFFNKKMALSIFIGTVIVLFYCYDTLMYKHWGNPKYELQGYRTFGHNTVTTFWIIKNINVYYYYMYYLIPMIAVIPFGLSYLQEKKAGIIKNIVVRDDRKKYVNRKFVVNFIAGGVATLYIPILSLLMLLPKISIQKTSSISDWDGAGFNSSFLCELYFTNTLLFVLIFLLLYFMVGGLLASISLTVSTFSRNKLTVFLTPFFIMLFLFFIRNAVSETDYSIMFQAICPYDFLQCNYSHGYTLPLVAGMAAFTLLNYLIFRKRIVGKDVF